MSQPRMEPIVQGWDLTDYMLWGIIMGSLGIMVWSFVGLLWGG